MMQNELIVSLIIILSYYRIFDSYVIRKLLSKKINNFMCDYKERELFYNKIINSFNWFCDLTNNSQIVCQDCTLIVI